MATIQTLKHGEPNWDAKVNANFAALVNDSKSLVDNFGSYKTTTNIVGLNGASPRASDAWVRLYSFGQLAILHWDIHVDNVSSWTSGVIKSCLAIDSDWIGNWTYGDSWANSVELISGKLTQNSWLASPRNPGELSLRLWGDGSQATGGIEVSGWEIITRK